MWSLLLGAMNPMSSICMIPMAILAFVAAICGILGCVKCARCRLRDSACIRNLFLSTGHDTFAEMDLMILVHEVLFDWEGISKFIVQLTAGEHSVRTDPNAKGVWQQPMHITVEQGTTKVLVELLDNWNTLLGVLTLDIEQDILAKGGKTTEPETVFPMKQKSKSIRNPRIKLTVVHQDGNAGEKGTTDVENMTDVDILVQQQMRKAKERNTGDHELSELDVIKEACSGPLEIFEGLGNTEKIYVAVMGPPDSRRWVLGIWDNKNDYEKEPRKQPRQEVDLMKVQSIQADANRLNVFAVNSIDSNKNRAALTFRRIDRNRDVWVEILHLLVVKCRESKQARQSGKDGTKRASKKKGTKDEKEPRKLFGFLRGGHGEKGEHKKDGKTKV